MSNISISDFKRLLFGALWVSNGDPVIADTDDLVDDLYHAIGDFGSLVYITNPDEFADALQRLELSQSTQVFAIYKFYDESVKNYVVFNYDWTYEQK